MDIPTMSSSEFWINFVLATLATWRVSYLLAYEDGPRSIMAHLRAYFAGSEIGRMLDCFGCVSLWVALPAAMWLSRRLPDFCPIWLALSGAAFLLERLGGAPLIVERFIEPEGVANDDLLRTETDNPAWRTGNAGHGNQGNG
jgi:hypothetical protein